MMERKEWKEMRFRTLTAEEIDCRVATVNENGCSLLLYKDARCDMNILDETVGPENWQRDHYDCKGNLFCKVGINVRYGDPASEPRWVWKGDCGSESRTEAEKGEASDSFKRACFNWGIGRELYTAPFIWVKAVDKNGEPNYKVNQKGQPCSKFQVTYIRIEDGKIVALNIEANHKTVFMFGNCFPNNCEVCGHEVSDKIAAGSRKKYGHVYCSGACMERAKHD